ncbi:MAG: DUF5658 family protein [Christensenellales bacterium]|jgi:hypothetical protein
MLAFFKDCTLSNIRTKLFAVYALCVADILLTLLLKSTGMFAEANPVMALFMHSIFLALAVKTLLPAAAFVLLYFRMKAATDIQLKISNRVIVAALMFYALVNALHIVWLFAYLARK